MKGRAGWTARSAAKRARSTRAAAVPAAAEDMALDNGRLRAVFNDRGLVSLAAPQTGRLLTLSADPSSITLDGAAVLDASWLPCGTRFATTNCAGELTVYGLARDGAARSLASAPYAQYLSYDYAQVRERPLTSCVYMFVCV